MEKGADITQDKRVDAEDNWIVYIRPSKVAAGKWYKLEESLNWGGKEDLFATILKGLKDFWVWNM